MASAPHSSKMSGEEVPSSRRHGSGEMKNDQMLVDEASLESFPASDPPAWTGTHVGTPSHHPMRTATPAELRASLHADVGALALAEGSAAVTELVTAGFLAGDWPVVRSPLPLQPGIENVEAVIRAAQGGDELVIAAAYDSGEGTLPCAPSVAVLLGLGRILAGQRFPRTVRLVAFARNGSKAYADKLRDQGISLRGMISIDSVGFYADRHELPRLPAPLRLITQRLLPQWSGSFLAFVGDSRSRELVKTSAAAFRMGTRLEAKALTLPGMLPLLGSSDIRSFTHDGYLAALITDTGPLRRHHSPTARELQGLLNYDLMADVVFGLASVVARLASG